MKKIIFTLALTAYTAVSVLSGCGSSTGTAESFRTDIQVQDKTKNHFSKSQKAFFLELLYFKMNSDEQISAHEKQIAELKIMTASEKGFVNTIFVKKLAVAEQQNCDMKKKLAGFKFENNRQWILFKTKYNRDLNLLSETFTDLSNNKI
jgi:hypothetical protein